jgi:dipeptidase
MAVVKGKQYVAVRLPDDCVAIIPNYYTIREFDTTDKQNVIFSKNLFNYAASKGWYKPQEETFVFRNVYGDPESLISINNIPRHWAGLNILHKNYEI